LYYYSEVSAEVSITSHRQKFIVSATHPTNNVGINCWFHFCDIDGSGNLLEFKSDECEYALAQLANELLPGAMTILEKHDIDTPERQFFTDFMCAATTGFYSIGNSQDKEYYHPAREWLQSVASEQT